jgi:hypothetical protein
MLSAGDSLDNLTSTTGQVSITAGAAAAGPASSPAGAGVPPGAVAKTQPAVEPRAKATSLVLVKNGKALLKLSCAAGPGCRGVAKLSVLLKANGRDRADAKAVSLEIGKAAFDISGARAQTVPVKLSSKAEAQVRAAIKSGGLKAHLAGTGVEARTVVLKEARRR